MLVRLLSGKPFDHVEMTPPRKVALTVVGDDDQSIYAFRGAKPNVMGCLNETLAQTSHVHVHALMVNYRSTQAIVDECQALMWPHKENLLPQRGKAHHTFRAADQNKDSLPVFQNHVARCVVTDVKDDLASSQSFFLSLVLNASFFPPN